MIKNFASRLLFKGCIEQDYLSKNLKNFDFWVFNKHVNFISESAKATIYYLVFLIFSAASMAPEILKWVIPTFIQ